MATTVFFPMDERKKEQQFTRDGVAGKGEGMQLRVVVSADRGHFPRMKLRADMLAPGDGKSAALDPALFDWTRICAREDGDFERAYAALWGEFGEAGEMESREVIAGRFAMGAAMRYELVMVSRDGALAAVRDHTAIWAEGEVVVHLSHVLVAPEWRRSGLAGWLRAVPIVAARAVAAAHGAADEAVTLVGEMEHDDGSDTKRAVRLAAYERAGYRKLDVRYFQPDFRAPAEMDATGGARPLPFQLIVRRVGREGECAMPGRDVRRIVSALYAMYGAQFRPQDMAHPALSMAALPGDGEMVALLPPTAR